MIITYFVLFVTRAVQNGSFPIVNPLNESFPHHMHRLNPNQETYEIPEDLPEALSLSLIVKNPNPGFWFIIAWLPQDKNDRIKQEVSGRRIPGHFVQI